MKNLKQMAPLVMAGVMAGTMLVSPISASAQTQTKEESTSVVGDAIVYADNYSYPGIIRGDNVQMRKTAGLSGTVLLQFPNNCHISIDKSKTVKVDNMWWYACKYNNTYGYVAAQYVYLIPVG